MRFHTRKWVKPEDLNPNGTLFGGKLLGKAGGLYLGSAAVFGSRMFEENLKKGDEQLKDDGQQKFGNHRSKFGKRRKITIAQAKKIIKKLMKM